MDLCEFKAILDYMRLNLSKSETELTYDPSTLNPNIREVETEVIWLGGGRNIRQEETGAQCSLRIQSEMQSEFVGIGGPLWSEHW